MDIGSLIGGALQAAAPIAQNLAPMLGAAAPAAQGLLDSLGSSGAIDGAIKGVTQLAGGGGFDLGGIGDLFSGLFGGGAKDGFSGVLDSLLGTFQDFVTPFLDLKFDDLLGDLFGGLFGGKSPLGGLEDLPFGKEALGLLGGAAPKGGDSRKGDAGPKGDAPAPATKPTGASKPTPESGSSTSSGSGNAPSQTGGSPSQSDWTGGTTDTGSTSSAPASTTPPATTPPPASEPAPAPAIKDRNGNGVDDAAELADPSAAAGKPYDASTNWRPKTVYDANFVGPIPVDAERAGTTLVANASGQQFRREAVSGDGVTYTPVPTPPPGTPVITTPNGPTEPAVDPAAPE